jgi:WS/DGAT/MGAT family acyltransferase
MQVGAVVVLDGPVNASELAATLAERAATVPRLRQRLMATPFGGGRPVWIDDPDFDVMRHVSVRRDVGPGDEAALLDLAADVVWTRLPAGRPQWRAVVVDGLAERRAAVVIGFHHVLADGIGGLAVLAHLVDGGTDGSGTPGTSTPPRPAPGSATLVLDAWRERAASLGRLPRTWRRWRDALRTLRATPRPRASSSSLNRPTGAHRALAVARTDLEPLHRVARSLDATVNDVVLTCVAGALHEVLQQRGEQVEHFVMSIPVSARQRAEVAHLGNEVGTALVDVPATGDLDDRLATVAARTRAAKQAASGESAASLVAPLFRLLARVGAFGWFIARQRTVNTFVTNLRGPEERLHLGGHEVLDIVPVALITGNVTVAFAVLSYAGRLDVTVLADPRACPDWRSIHQVLQRELDQLALE